MANSMTYGDRIAGSREPAARGGGVARMFALIAAGGLAALSMGAAHTAPLRASASASAPGGRFAAPPAAELFSARPLAAQSYEPHTGQPAVVKQIASDLYFFYDFDGSNCVFLVTDAGVLVIDTREHPRAAQDLLALIRKVTDKPIRWVINSHFHGDHTYGNAAFQAAGATFLAQQETARIMKLAQPKEMARRQDYFKEHNYDPNQVKLN